MARGAISALLAASLLSGCATFDRNITTAALGSGKHGSIKDDPEPAAASPPPAHRPRKRIALLPQSRVYRPAAGHRLELPNCGTGTDCLVRLKALIADPERRWVREPAPAAEYANGTRLFAYRALRGQLSCAEIELALGEIGQAAAAFGSPVPGVSATQASRVLSLNAEVGEELAREFSNRCRG